MAIVAFLENMPTCGQLMDHIIAFRVNNCFMDCFRTILLIESSIFFCNLSFVQIFPDIFLRYLRFSREKSVLWAQQNMSFLKFNRICSQVHYFWSHLPKKQKDIFFLKIKTRVTWHVGAQKIKIEGARPRQTAQEFHTSMKSVIKIWDFYFCF